MNPFKSLTKLFGLGQDSDSSDVPPFGHASKANDALDKAAVLARFAEPVDMVSDGASLLVADGTTVVRLALDGTATRLYDAGKAITAIAVVDGGFACAVEGREIRIIGGHFDGKVFAGPQGAGFNAVNALTSDGGCLLATDGSQQFAPDEWRHDLMKKGKTGRVISVELASGATKVLKSGLRSAFGVAAMGRQALVSEPWAHRLIKVGADGGTQVVQDDFPAYPSRLSPAHDGYWLTMSCVRSELIEFVLRETEYRSRMMESLDPHLWIAPQLRSFTHAQEPVQWGAVRQQGVIKPWAPTRSYGLVVKLNAAGELQYSLHCRAGGAVHGLLAAAEIDGILYLLSRGDRSIRKIDIVAAEQEIKQ